MTKQVVRELVHGFTNQDEKEQVHVSLIVIVT